MELAQLKYFITIAETLSFTLAAETLKVSQPALSYQIIRLEAELGTKLFDRSKRRIRLTGDGEYFLPMAQLVLFNADEATRSLRDHVGLEASEVTIGSNPSVATYLMPQLLASFRKEYPRIRISLVEDNDAELQAGVVDGSIDFAIVTAAASPGSVRVEYLTSEDIVVALPLDHRLAGRRNVTLAELATEDFVSPSDTFRVTTQFVDHCHRAGFEPRIIFQVGSFESAKSLVHQCNCAAMLPTMALTPDDGQNLALIPLEDGWQRELSLIQSKDHSIGRSAKALLSHIQVNLPKQVAEKESELNAIMRIRE
jgi:DNA-binding transcriptional LysR family regulator